MESIVMGTAGHIDHGKTTLVKALTGRDTDTLEEEQRRGITINLGFAYFTLPNGKIAGIVDVPGHERFIKNMLAGASGIDVAMVVIAANEGVMPQTREHIDILRYMNIQESVVVLTKIDMVDEDFKELVIEDTKEYLQNGFLKNAPIFEVDAISKQGIDPLINYLNQISQNIKKRNIRKAARMYVDRSFAVKGFGTVATGTLLDGMVHSDDELLVYPQGTPTKVRNLQIHEQDVEQAYAGQRTAMNLGKVTVEQVPRGSVLAKKDSVQCTRLIDVFFSLTEHTMVKVKKMDEVKLYLGAKEVVAKIVPFSSPVSAGGEAYGQILLEQEAVVRKGDSFVLRTLSPMETIGGGRIVDPDVQRQKKVSDTYLKTIAKKDMGSEKEMLEAFAQDHPFQTEVQLAYRLNVDSVTDSLKTLEEEKHLLGVAGRYIHINTANQVLAEIKTILQQYHEQYPLRAGMPKAELLSRQTHIPSDADFEPLLMQFVAENEIRMFAHVVALHNFSPSFSEEQKVIRKKLEEKVEQAGFTLLSIQDINENDPMNIQITEILLQDQWILLEGHMVLSHKRCEEAKTIVLNLAKQHEGVIKLSDFRDQLQTSRKFALALLEYFDKEKVTRRSGEDRILF